MNYLFSDRIDSLSFGKLNVLCNSKETLDSKYINLKFGHLALVNGMLSCANTDLLMQATGSNQENLLTYIFTKACDLCYLTDCQYHSFKLLYQWFQRTAKHLKQIVKHQPTIPLFGNEDCMFVTKSLKVLWTHLDSPVDGVNESVMEIFKLLLNLQSQEQAVRDELMPQCVGQADDLQKSTYSTVPLAECLLPKVLAMSWKVKGKQIMLASLIPHLSVIKVLHGSLGP